MMIPFFFQLFTSKISVNHLIQKLLYNGVYYTPDTRSRLIMLLMNFHKQFTIASVM